MGGRRCGKTSALSSLFDQIVNGPTNEILTASDQTVLEAKSNPASGLSEKQDSLSGKKLELRSFIAKGGNNTFLADQNPTSNFWDYKLQIKIPGTSKSMDLTFRDSAGEFFEAGSQHHDKTVQFVKECDVFVVVVDTPYLMAGSEEEALAANVVDSIHSFLTQIDNDSNRSAKQVIFLPIKCEKWFHEGKIDTVVEKIKTTYATSIKELKARNKTEISILPILTAGDITFAELREPYILVDPVTNRERRCSRISDRMVVLADGKNYKVASHEILNEDPQGIFTNAPGIKRPSAWYRLKNGRESKYTPYNCEQLPLHIIRFMFNKKKSEAPSGFLGFLANLFFGSITAGDVQKALDQLSSENLLKDSGEGITILKKCF